MNGLSNWKIALYLTAIFGAGAVSGWFIGAKTAKEEMFMPPPWEKIVASQREELNSKLNLTPEQAKQLDAVLERSSTDMKSLFEGHKKNIRQVISNRNNQIAAILNPEQEKLFEQIEKERQEAWRKKEGGRGRHGGRDGRRGPPRDRDMTNNPAKGTNGIVVPQPEPKPSQGAP